MRPRGGRPSSPEPLLEISDELVASVAGDLGRDLLVTLLRDPGHGTRRLNAVLSPSGVVDDPLESLLGTRRDPVARCVDFDVLLLREVLEQGSCVHALLRALLDLVRLDGAAVDLVPGEEPCPILVLALLGLLPQSLGEVELHGFLQGPRLSRGG